MKKNVIKFFRKLIGFNVLNEVVTANKEEILLTMGKVLENQFKQIDQIKNLKDIEFKIFSQWGDDGIINWIFNKIPGSENPVFIEFGVQHYTESNTRYLLKSQNWKGIVLDGNADYINYIKNDPIYWMHDLTAANQFITRNNINELLIKYSDGMEVDLLSIDIDGNDYWIFKEINSIRPKVIICEYNGIFGKNALVTTPYKEDFYRTAEHYSNLYFGASISALIELAKSKNYIFIGTNSNGNNAYFIRDDVQNFILPLIKEIKIFDPKFRESRNESGELTYLTPSQGRELIADLPLIDIKTNQQVQASHVLN